MSAKARPTVIPPRTTLFSCYPEVAMVLVATRNKRSTQSDHERSENTHQDEITSRVQVLTCTDK